MSSAEYSCKFFKPIFAHRQTVWTQIRLLLEEQFDLGPHCLQKWLLNHKQMTKQTTIVVIGNLRFNMCLVYSSDRQTYISLLAPKAGNLTQYDSTICVFCGLIILQMLTFSPLSFWHGLFHLWIWTHPMLQIGVSVKIQRQNGEQYRPRWDSSLQALSSGSALFAKVSVLVCRNGRVKFNLFVLMLYVPVNSLGSCWVW